jgi:hypothetical protein
MDFVRKHSFPDKCLPAKSWTDYILSEQAERQSIPAAVVSFSLVECADRGSTSGI